MNANAELQKQIVNYAKTRAVYVEYRKAGYSKKYRIGNEFTKFRYSLVS